MKYFIHSSGSNYVRWDEVSHDVHYFDIGRSRSWYKSINNWDNIKRLVDDGYYIPCDYHEPGTVEVDEGL